MRLCAVILFAFLLDFLLGDPVIFVHPVVLIGNLISFIEGLIYPKNLKSQKNLNNSLFFRGLVLVIIVCIISFTVPFFIIYFCNYFHPVLGFCAEVIISWNCIAAKTLSKECKNVYKALQIDLNTARCAVGRIVGRDTKNLDNNGIIRASIETCAESTTDGVISPLFFLAIASAPLGMLYKAINTMDSMIAYKNERYLYFGRAAAKLDDIANFIPARIAAFLMIAASAVLTFDYRNAAKIFFRDRLKHESPNSAQTESVMAGALRIRLGGNAFYEGKLEKKQYLGDELKPVESEDIKKAISLMYLTSVFAVLIFSFLIAVVGL